MDLPLAHAGHYLIGLLYMLPVVILGLALLWQRRRDARAVEIDNGELDNDAPKGEPDGL
jgi:hypothetical protein